MLQLHDLFWSLEVPKNASVAYSFKSLLRYLAPKQNVLCLKDCRCYALNDGLM